MSKYVKGVEVSLYDRAQTSQVNFLLVSKFAVWLSYFDIQRLYYTNKVVNP
jgi:hypothetical protein